MPDCVNPITCSGCGQTKGQPLGHTAGEPTYHSPAICSVCGEIAADKLPADMETYGITEFMQVGVAYPYTTWCYEDNTKDTTGELIVTSYEILESAGGFPAREGYQWHFVEMKATFFDDNAYNAGIQIGDCYENYYHIDYWDDSDYYDEKLEASVFKILYDGEEMEVIIQRIYREWSGWFWEDGVHKDYCIIKYACCIPNGYDGVILGQFNQRLSGTWDEGKHIYDVYRPGEFVLFRLGEEFCVPAVSDQPVSGKK